MASYRFTRSLDSGGRGSDKACITPQADEMTQPVYRFAPSPNGALHLGHAYSALLNQQLARAAGGKLLLRIEDLDRTRCTPALERNMLTDLAWLGIEWDEPPVRQSERRELYRDALNRLAEAGLSYPAFMSRSEVRRRIEREEAGGRNWPRDPDGTPLYPEDDRLRDKQSRAELLATGEPYALRLDLAGAIRRIGTTPKWLESGMGPNGETGVIDAEPRVWGDIILSGKDSMASYHLAAVVDDAMQGISDVVRGRDLFWSTAVHRVLQELFGFAVPRYHHHDLILAEDGRKLSKSHADTGLAALRAAGATPEDIRRMVGLDTESVRP